MDAVGGCLLWCERTGRLLWSDIAGATLWAWWPASGNSRSWPMPERLCCFALTGSNDRLLLGLASGLAFFSFSSGRIQRIHEVDAGNPSARLNDGRCDRQGRFVFGTVNEGEAEHGGLHRLNLDLTLERLPVETTAGANGICFSPDGRRMYFADAASGEIRYADYNPCSAEVGALHLFLAAGGAPGEPGGMTVDSEGCLWSARRGAGQVMRFTPGARLDRSIAAGARQPGCPAFGGPGLSTLYVGAMPSQAGAVWRHDPGPRGLPEARFLHA